MSVKITMPKLGLTMAEGKVVEWKKKEGEPVEKGQVVFVLETEKITYEVESQATGLLARIVVGAGETVPVGSVVAYIAAPGEALPDGAKEAAAVGSPASPSAAAAAPGEAAASGERQKVSPLARKLAEEHGLDISKITGTGPGGRIVKEDILKVAEQKKTAAEVKPAVKAEGAGVATASAHGRLVPLSGMRKTIARRLSQSFQTAPHLWNMITEVDVGKLKKVREALNPQVEARTKVKLTYTDFLIKMVAQVLAEQPNMNSRWTDEGIEVLDDINVGMAMNIPEGLVVPAVRQANKKSLAEIAAVRADLVERGRSRKLTLDEMTGSTFTITNLGMYGTDLGVPIINPPEAGILFVGSIKERPVVESGQIVIRLCVNLTVAVDHRVLDGYAAQMFLNRLKELIEEPLLLMA